MMGHDGCLTASGDGSSDKVVHAATMVQTARTYDTCRFFIPNKCQQRRNVGHHTAKEGDNHAKEQMLVFSFEERYCALPTMTPLLLLFTLTQGSGQATF